MICYNFLGRRKGPPGVFFQVRPSGVRCVTLKMQGILYCYGRIRRRNRMNRIPDKKNIIRILISIGIPLLYLFAVSKMTGLCFETNDDRVITEILSGTLTGEPDGHTVFLNYLLSYPLSVLYRVFVRIPWYGGLLVLCHFLAYAALLYSILSWERTLLEDFFLTGLVCCFALINIYLTSVIQFTSVSVLMAMTGYACLLLQKSGKKGRLFFFFFEFVAFLLRSEAMLMIQPLGGAAYLGLCLAEEDGSREEKLQKAGVMLLALGAVFLIGFSGNLLGYQGKEWEDYTRFSKARAELFDYQEYLPYEEAKPVLEDYHVTQTGYEAFYHYVILDDEVSTECVEALAGYAKNRKTEKPDIAQLAGRIWKPDQVAEYLKSEQVTVIKAVWLIIFLWILLWKKFYLLLPLGGFAIGKTLVWGYLLYRGRLPFRITYPLFACEILLITTLFLWDYLHQENTKKQEVSGITAFVVFAVCCFFAGKMQYRQALQANEWQEPYMQGFVEIQNYCGENPDKRYLLDCESFAYYTGSAFETEIYGSQNYVYTGSWFSKSPVLSRHMEEYFEGEHGGIYLIILDTENVETSPGVRLLTEKSGGSFMDSERITVSNGATYQVLHFTE